MAENELPENIADLPEIELQSADKPQKKKPRGRPITSENAKQFALSAARAKALRKEARAKMLNALTTRLDLGDELYKAMKAGDDKYLAMIEKATHLVGLTHEQSEEALAKRLDIKTDNTTKVDSTVKFIIEDAKESAG